MDTPSREGKVLSCEEHYGRRRRKRRQRFGDWAEGRRSSRGPSWAIPRAGHRVRGCRVWPLDVVQRYSRQVTGVSPPGVLVGPTAETVTPDDRGRDCWGRIDSSLVRAQYLQRRRSSRDGFQYLSTDLEIKQRYSSQYLLRSGSEARPVSLMKVSYSTSCLLQSDTLQQQARRSHRLWPTNGTGKSLATCRPSYPMIPRGGTSGSHMQPECLQSRHSGPLRVDIDTAPPLMNTLALARSYLVSRCRSLFADHLS